MNLLDITRKYLANYNYDGLVHPESECACLRDELMPCENPHPGCRPGYRAACDCGEECDFHISPDPAHQINDDNKPESAYRED